MTRWTDEDSRDLDAANLRIRRTEERERRVPVEASPRSRQRRPQPRQKPNGRWAAAAIVAGRRHYKTFGTHAEAQTWLDSLNGEH